MTDIKNLLRNYNNELEDYLQNNPVDENMLFEVVTTNNKSAYHLLMSKINVNQKEELFKNSLENANLYFAFDIFKKFKDEFNTYQDLTFKNNETHDDNARRFTNEEVFEENKSLPRFYQDITYNNTKELFAAMLLQDSLKTTGYSIESLEVLEYLLKNKQEFNIKDETIVQYFVESYSMNQLYEDISFKHEPQQFSKIIQILLDNKVSFESDTQGYLVQIAGHNINIANYNRLDINKDLIQGIIDNGSNIEQYKARLDNKDNWLNSSQDDIFVHHYDLYKNYVYDIYSQFDSRNSHTYLNYVTRLTGYVFKENTLPDYVDKSIIAEVKPSTIETPIDTSTNIHIEDNTIKNINSNDIRLSDTNKNELTANVSSVSTLGKLINSLRERFTKSDNSKNNIKNT